MEIDGERVEVPIDLIVPEGIAPPGATRGVRDGPHGKRAARKAPGLEAAIVDNDAFTIGALDDEDRRSIEGRVAGPTAPLIAKAHKISDRLAQEARRDRLIDKDASDVYRLLTTAPEGINEVVPTLLDDPRVGGPPQRGLELLSAQFGARRAPGCGVGSPRTASRRPRGSRQGGLRGLRCRAVVSLNEVSLVRGLSARCQRRPSDQASHGSRTGKSKRNRSGAAANKAWVAAQEGFEEALLDSRPHPVLRPTASSALSVSGLETHSGCGSTSSMPVWMARNAYSWLSAPPPGGISGPLGIVVGGVARFDVDREGEAGS